MTDSFGKRIETITEQDFWGSLRALPGLDQARKAGLAGNRDRAYNLLGQYHAQNLAEEAAAFVEQFRLSCRNASQVAANRAEADRVLRHDIQGWHSQSIHFGPVIDFNADFGRCGQYGFHYLVWLKPVLVQYVLTGKPKYRTCLLDILGQYYEQRTRIVQRIPGLNPVYYELGAWAKTTLILPAYAILSVERRLTADHREAMLKLLLGFARSLDYLQQTGFRHFGRGLDHRQRSGYRRGNWQIVGAAALFQLGCAFPEFRAAAAWRRRGAGRLIEHARKDFFPDGGHSERCWGYGWMSLKGMVEFYRIAQRFGYLSRGEQAFMTRFLKRGFRWFAASVTPTRHLLNYGDGSIGSAEEIFAAAEALFPSFRKEPGLFGIDRSKSCILKPSGYAFMRAGDSPEAPYLSINFGGYGGGHTHQDLLDFSLWSYGEPLIEEVGRFGSYDNPFDPFFRSDVAHNQIVIEHKPMDRRNHQAQDLVWHSTATVDFFSAWHGAYAGVKVLRHIVFVKPRYWVLYDVIRAAEQTFHASSYLHSPRPFQVLAPGRARLAGNKSCLVVFARPTEIRRFKTGVDYSRAESSGPSGAVAFYEFAVNRYRLVATQWRDVGDSRPLTFATLLVPFKDGLVPNVEFVPVPHPAATSGGAEAFAVNFESHHDLLVFNPAGKAVRFGHRQVSCAMAVRLGKTWIGTSVPAPVDG